MKARNTPHVDCEDSDADELDSAEVADQNSGSTDDTVEYDDASTQDKVEKNTRCRSNSSVVDESGTPSPIRYSDRNHTEDCKVKKNPMKDAITISAISLEAGAKFHKRYHEYLKKDKTFNSKTVGNLKSRIVGFFHKNVEYTQAASYAGAFSEFLKNKEPAHVIAIIEGSRNNFPQSFTAKDNDGKEYHYDLNEFHLIGVDNRKRNDDKQNMNFYVRRDMKKALKFNKSAISVAKIGEFPIAEILFSTHSRKNYGALVVHIPNKFTTTHIKCDQVHKAFEEYAKTKETKNNVTLICYMGDTNYKKNIQTNSKPSYGGNQGTSYLSLTSSSAAKHTDFMQCISLTKSPSVKLSQPSTLNLVELTGASTPDKTDHPSIQTIVLVDSHVQDKPKKPVAKRKIDLSEEAKSTSEAETSDNRLSL